MTTALTNSVNTWWAQAGEKLGKDTMFKYMDRFGFDAKPRLDYPGFQLAASGVYDGNKLLGPSDPIDIGRVAIGQERLPRDAAADGRGRRDGRQQRRADGAAALVEGDRPRWAGDETRSRPSESSDERGHRVASSTR